MEILAILRARLGKLSWQHGAIFILVLIACCLRFWGLTSSTQFLGDQGRDALIVSNIFKHNDIVAIGPTTSVGNIYLGPLYYYFMLPFLYFSYPSPLGPVYAVAVLGTLTVFCIYYWGRKLVGEGASLFAAFLCTFSVVAFNLSRFSWNPNPMPFVMMVMLFFTYLAFTRHTKYWLGVAACFAVLLQLHYVTLLAGVAAGVLWLIQLIQKIRSQQPWKDMFLYAVGAVILVILSLAPLILFDLKHGGLNRLAFEKMFTQSGNFSGSHAKETSLLDVLRETHGRSMHILFEFQIGKERSLNTFLVLALASATLYFLFLKKQKQHTGLVIISVYLLVGIIGFSFYKNSVFDHYIAYLFPCTFLLLGFYLSKLWHHKGMGKILVIAAILYFLTYNIPKFTFFHDYDTLQQLRQVSDTIHQRVAVGQRYGIVLLSSTRDYQAMNYRYFLSTDLQKEPVPPSAHSDADLLFVIDEEKLHKNPEKTDIYEIASFPPSVVQERYAVPNGPDIIVLRKVVGQQ